MMQNSLERLFDGMAEALRDVVLPAVDDEFARSQVAACIELLGNLSTRVEWRADQLRDVTDRADQAVMASLAAAPGLLEAIGSAPATPAAPGAVDQSGRVRARDDALARVSTALRWCDDRPADEATLGPLLAFARWHLDHELSLLRTGMFRR